MIPRIGIIDDTPIWDHFRQGLRDLGCVEGQNIAIEYRTAEGNFDRLRQAALELALLPGNVLVVYGSPATRAEARQQDEPLELPPRLTSIYAIMLLPRTLSAGFIPPCLPTSAPIPPSGDVWLHEIKHDGFRVIARKIGKRVKLYSRPGNDLTYRFPLIVEALARLRSRSCIIDGEAVACGDDGIARFDRIRYRHHDPDRA